MATYYVRAVGNVGAAIARPLGGWNKIAGRDFGSVMAALKFRTNGVGVRPVIRYADDASFFNNPGSWTAIDSTYRTADWADSNISVTPTSDKLYYQLGIETTTTDAVTECRLIVDVPLS